jgi:hypothetical protein
LGWRVVLASETVARKSVALGRCLAQWRYPRRLIPANPSPLIASQPAAQANVNRAGKPGETFAVRAKGERPRGKRTLVGRAAAGVNDEVSVCLVGAAQVEVRSYVDEAYLFQFRYE